MRLRSGLLIAAAALVVTGPVCAAEVVALGASNTFGRGQGRHADGVPKAQAYPAQLQAMLAAKGCRARVLNAGVPGDTTAGMLARLPGLLRKDVKVLVLQPGGNDARQGQYDTQANIDAISSYAAARGVKVVQMGRLSMASGYRLPDGQHFSAEGHAIFARSVLSDVAAAACGG